MRYDLTRQWYFTPTKGETGSELTIAEVEDINPEYEKVGRSMSMMIISMAVIIINGNVANVLLLLRRIPEQEVLFSKTSNTEHASTELAEFQPESEESTYHQTALFSGLIKHRLSKSNC